MVLTEKEKKFIKRKKKLWDLFGWAYKGSGRSYFKRNHSLNDGCNQCKAKTSIRRLKNKQERLNAKTELSNMEESFQIL